MVATCAPQQQIQLVCLSSTKACYPKVVACTPIALLCMCERKLVFMGEGVAIVVLPLFFFLFLLFKSFLVAYTSVSLC